MPCGGPGAMFLPSPVDSMKYSVISGSWLSSGTHHSCSGSTWCCFVFEAIDQLLGTYHKPLLSVKRCLTLSLLTSAMHSSLQGSLCIFNPVKGGSRRIQKEVLLNTCTSTVSIPSLRSWSSSSSNAMWMLTLDWMRVIPHYSNPIVAFSTNLCWQSDEEVCQFFHISANLTVAPMVLVNLLT